MPSLTHENRIFSPYHPRTKIAKPFTGFAAPTSNTTFAPNQFFDACLPYHSRGVVRLVAYLIRKTLGWCDTQGNPQEEQISVSYRELITKAGISRDMIRQALNEAVAGHFIECVHEGRANSTGEVGQSACYQLRWDASPEYRKKPADFRTLVHDEMKYYLRAYLDILDAQKEEKPGWENVFYHCQWGIADSLSFALMLAPLKSTDSPDVTRQKINEVARFMETFSVRRSINFRKFGASSIRYTMYSLVKELRGKDLVSLQALLKAKLTEMPEKWEGMAEFRLHGMNRYFVKFLLSRITGFIEQQSGASTNFSTYFVSPGTKPYEVEHIWADKFEEHRDEFEQRHEFDNYRNRIGDLVLLPQGTNQSYGAMGYSEKIEHYLKENLLVKSLHPKGYENNPNFVGMAKNLGLKFKAHKAYAKADIDERQTLVQSICEAIWGE